MKRWFRASLRRRAGKKVQRQAPSKASAQAGLFRAIGWEQLESRVLLTAQLLVNTVNDSGPGSLRDAITQANSDGGGEISFNIPNDSAQNPQTIGLLSALPALGNGITISGPGADELTISGDDKFQVFAVPSTSTVTISGLTIAHGSNSTAAATNDEVGHPVVEGGGIVNDGNLTLSADTVSNNVATSAATGTDVRGGAIFSDGTLTLVNDQFANNSATSSVPDRDASGGAIFSSGTLTVSGSTFTSNKVMASGNAAFAEGGAIRSDGTLNATASVFSSNAVTSDEDSGGGALAVNAATIQACTIGGNTSTATGTHGVAFGGGIEGGGAIEIIDSTISGNAASSAGSGALAEGAGGGLDVGGTDVSIVNCTIAGNSATCPASAVGGALTADNSVSVQLTNCTVAGNSVSSTNGGSTGGISRQNGQAHIFLQNTIVAGNTVGPGGQDPDVSGTLGGDHSLIGIGDGSSGISNGTAGNQVGTSASPIDPKLGQLANNGGPTQTMALLSGSPAIDAGNNANANDPQGFPLTTDQRGAGFPRTINGTVDIGAFEVLLNLVVNTTADSGPGSLRDAITQANSDGGGEISFNIPNDSAQNPQTIGLLSALPALGDGITISGPGAAALTVSGRNSFQVFHIASGATVSISDLSIENGNNHTPAVHGSATFVAGGGIENDGTLTLTDDVVSNNSVFDGSNIAEGGGIYNDGTLAINGSTIANNTADEDGANDAKGGGIGNDGTLTITGSMISGNVALNGNSTRSVGGGIATSGVLTLLDSTISGNTARSSGTGSEADGGGIDAESGAAVELTNCTIAGNSLQGVNVSSGPLAKGYGGGISGSSATITLTNCTVAGNTAVTAGGGIDVAGQGSVTLNLTNTIVATNTVAAGGTNADVNGTVSSADHDLIGDGTSSGVANGTNGNQVGTAADPLDPKLGPLSNNGGPTQTMPLESTSPAIDTGDNTAVANPPFPGPPFTDQRGTGFPRIVNGTVDIGAVEFSPLPNLVVTTKDDDLDGGTLANSDGPDGTLSLREAITLANLEGGGTITFDIPGTSAQSPQTIALASALPALNAAMTISGPGADELTVSGTDRFQVFNVTSGSIVSISGLTIAHGFNNTPALNGGVIPFVAGGGIFNAGTLTLTSDALTNNVATNSNNNGVAEGGAIFDAGTLTVNGCTITNNSASATGGGVTPRALGGAIAEINLGFPNPVATLTVTDSSISGNSVSAPLFEALGGGLDLDGAASVTQTTVSGNTADGASGQGGGIYDNSSLNCTIADSTISGNTANATAAGLGEGGGIVDNASATLAVTNCTIVNNTVNSSGRGVGGGIVAFEDVDTPLTLTNCTVTGNADNFTSLGAAPESGGGGIWDNAIIGLVNTIVAGNTETAGGTGADVSNDAGSPVSPDDHNLIGIGDGSGLTNGRNGDQVGTAASPLDAKLGTLADNGGPTQTVALLVGSPAIDAGDNAAVTNPPFPGPPFTDQRAAGFPRIINGTVDIGAFELLPNLVVTTTTDDNDGGTVGDPDGPDGTLSLREAIEVANAEGGGDITFDIPGDSVQTPQTITLGSALPAITGAVTITGPGAEQLTVSGNDQFQVFNVPSTSTVTISGLTIAHGFVSTAAKHGQGTFVAGGGLQNDGTLTLSGDLLTNNAAEDPATDSGGAVGGAVVNDGMLTITNCNFSNNQATAPNAPSDLSGGGALDNIGTLIVTGSAFSNNTAAHLGGAIANVGTAAITASTISGNRASAGGKGGGIGGGIASILATGPLTIVDSTISGNTASGSGPGSTSAGGGLSVAGTGITLVNCTIQGNTASGPTADGGGIFFNVASGSVTLTNCTVADNSTTPTTAGQDTGGGIDAVAGTLDLTNTIVAKNIIDATGTGPDIAGAVTTADHNLIGIGDGSTGIANGTDGNQVGTADNPIEPKLGNLANNGGPTETMQLLSGSPAIDAGDNTAVTNPPFPGPPFADQRGAGFPRIADGTVDIGAFELQPVTPGTITWTGGSTTDSNWSDPANWNLGRAPVSGDSVVFPDENVARTTNTNDISGLSLNSITFQDEAGGATATPYTITGDAVTIGAGGIVDGVSGTSTAAHIDELNLDVTLGANQSWSMATTAPSSSAAKFETLQLGGTVALGAFNLDLAANTGDTNDVFYFGGAVSGAGQLSVDMSASGTMSLAHADSYTGGTRVNSGTLFAADGALGPAPNDGGTTIGNQAVLYVATAYKTPEAVTVDSGTVFGFNFGPDSFAGPITFNSSNGKNDLAISTAPFTLQGDVTFGNFDLHAINEASDSPSTLIFDGTMSGGGTLQVLSGADFGGANHSGPLTLAGTGTVSAPINVSSGSTIEPGDPGAATTTGTLHVANVTFQSGSTFASQINGTAAGQFDQLDSTGTITLGGATLSVTSAGGFAPGTKLVIIQAANPILGTFNGLPEGSSVTVGGRNFTISYAGDQVTLSLAGITPGTITWTGGSASDSNWSDPANWDLNRAPINGDSLVFPATAQRLTNSDDISGLSVSSLTFQGNFTTVTGGYTLSGDALTVGAGGVADNGTIPSGDTTSLLNQVDLNVTLAAAQSWSIDDNNNFHHLLVNGNVDNGGFALTTVGSGTIDVAGQISGSGSLTVDAGAAGNFLSVNLHQANSYTGGTQIINGFVDVSADGALGPGGMNDAGTTVGALGQLELHAVAYNTPEALTLDGILGNESGNSSFAGPITITGASSGTGNGLPVAVDAQISDLGEGTFTLNGPTLVNDGHAALLIQGANLALGDSSVVAISNVISGPGGLLVAAADVQLQAANTYQGATLLGGTAEIDVGVDNAIPSASGVMLQAAAGISNLLKLAGNTDTIASLTGTQSGGATNTFALGTGGALTTGGDNTSTNFAGDITGSGTLTKQGTGTFDLTATNDYTGTTTVASGTLIVDGSTPLGNAVIVDGGATLGGTGTVGGNTTVGGTLDPGAGPDPSADTGTLNDTGDVTTFQTGSTFAVQLGGTAASPTNDQLDSTGAVTLGATLDLSLLAGAGPFNAGQQFVIVQADAPISGTFNGLPEAGIISAGGQNFSVSYANDKVTLTTLPALVVTTADDDNDGGTLADPLGADGKLSLREAIELANLYGGPQTISFDIPGSGVQTIHVGSTGLGSLPKIAVPVTIDGYTQPGARANTLPTGDNAVILIALDGNATDGQGNDVSGIQVTGGNSTVRGLAIGNFGTSISGAEGQSGISISGAGGNTIAGNFIGTDATGKTAAPNFTAVEIVGSSNNTVGGTAPADRNVLSGNGSGGGVSIRVAADKTPAGGNAVEGNFIGLDVTGKTAIDNSGTGVDILGASGNTIGGTAAGAGNVISGNDGGGVGIEADLSSITVGNQSGATGLDAQNNLVEGNLIGTDVSGSAAIGNGNVDGALFIIGQPGTNDNNIIGGTTAAARNVISGNGYSGIELSGDGNLIEGNYIGPDVTGTKLLSLTGASFPVGNGGNGIFIDGGSNNTLGGTAPGAGNVISGNGDPTQSTGDGILIEPFYTTVAGQAEIHSATGNLIEGNLIGTDATGQKALGNIGGGVVLHGVSGNQAGGTSAAAANVISANGAVGVGVLSDNISDGLGDRKPFDAKNNLIDGNFIGTDRSGTVHLGNGTAGVAIASIAASAANNTIGGTAAGAGNIIAFNKQQGVVVGHAANENATTGNAIEGDLIFGNGALGIDLGDDGVTQNTPGGPHAGPNDLQNFPVITSATATTTGLNTAILGTFSGAPNQKYTLEFYSDSTADPSGHGQGQTFLGRLNVPTDASGNFNFTAIVAAPPVGQTVFSATATDASGNTSEFSADFQAPTQTATYLNGQAGDDTAATFIHNLYRETLGREPEATDQAFWVNAYNQALSKGTAADAQQTVVADFLASVEYRTHLVIAAYHDFLHRAPEAGGLQFWLARLDDGLDESVLLAEFVGGDEYFNDAGGNAAGWVNALYRDLLGRASEAGGLAYWEQQDQPSSGQPANRVTISLEFLSAPETEHKLLNADYPGSPPPGAPGTAAVGAFALADITGDGWENLYFQGSLSTAAVDALFAELQAGASDDSVIAGMLDMDQYFAG